MESWKKLSLSIGTALVAVRFWRRPDHDDPRRSAEDEDDKRTSPSATDETELWIELDVAPLFPSSQPVGREYLIDLDTDPDGDPSH